MSLTAPYRQHNFMGEHAGDAACLTFIQANKWDSNGDGTGNPRNGMWYYQSTDHKFRGYVNGAWADVTGGSTDNDAIHDNVANEISAITEKTTPVSGDLLVIEDSAASYVKKKLQIGNLPSSGGGTQRQESVTTQNITTDTALTDQLDYTPLNANAVQLFLNGVHQQQGSGKDYTVSGKVITWLAGTGTAVDMETTDVLIAKYVS